MYKHGDPIPEFIKFFVQPQHIPSYNDSDVHYITTDNLIRCYGIPRSKVTTMIDENTVLLAPVFNGDYKGVLESSINELLQNKNYT